ncbi:MAG: VWA domain-containing protein [Methanomicrobiaceae archaeon]|nr:VWA domain-containing protein [Methanomicrobiaceae archaeon]
MRKSTTIILLMMLSTLFLVNTTSALEDSEVILQTDNDWIVAGGASATISVSETNMSCTIDSVDFECLQSGIYGDVNAKTVSSSPFATSFSSTKSGTADIQATVAYSDDNGNAGIVVKTIQQKIDHAAPDSIQSVSYTNEVTVGGVTPIAVRMVDIYNNPVESRYEDEMSETPEYLDLYCSPADSYLYDGAGYTLNYDRIYVDSEGVLETGYMVSTISGTNTFTITSPYGFRSQYKTVTGVADSEPVSIIAAVNPLNGDPPYLPADGESKFYITYYLKDEYGNPAGSRNLNIVSSDPEYLIGVRTSNSYGVINISYGPVYQKGVYTVTAYSLDNESVRVETDIQFDSTDPVNMLLTANPEVMPSNEVAPLRTSAIRAKVIDERGNPVENEVVSFSIIHGSYPVYQTDDPFLSDATAITDEDGQAIVYFTSGTFISDVFDPDYENMGSASCTVEAEWDTVYKTILIEWKNYPYLSVETEVSPETVAVNRTIDVTVRLIGDGWALQPDPIDVMLAADRSGSMLTDYPDRMVSVMDAMQEFNSGMSEMRDRVGLTSFGNDGTTDITTYSSSYLAGYDGRRYVWFTGWVSDPDDDDEYISNHYQANGREYDDYATLDLSLTSDHISVESEIDDLVPMGGTPMRKGLYLAIKEIVDNGRDAAVKAVILLSDGEYNTGGDPLAESSGYEEYDGLTSEEQNLAIYAKNNDIKIYTIAYALAGSEVLEELADQSGGEYYIADSTNINDVYLEIAGDLRTEAGVNTQMSLDFSNLELNNVSTPNSDSSILQYVYEYDVSTTIEKWNETSTVIPRYTIDDTDDWSEDQALEFDVGTVKLLETWETTFRLRIMRGGNINIFGPGSTITFNNGTDSLSLPDTYVTAVYNITVTGTEFKDLSVSDLHSTNTGEITGTLNLEWTLFYSGESSAQQSMYYLKEGDGVWIPFKTMSGVSGPMSDSVIQKATLPVGDLPSGEYRIRVYASSLDTADSVSEMTQTIGSGSSGISYIKIE